METSFGFLVAGGKPAELFQPTEATFDTVTQLVQVAVVSALLSPVFSGRNDRFGTHGFFDVGQDAIEVVSFVADDRLRRTLAQQSVCLRAVIHLTGGNAKVQRLAFLIGQQMDFGGQTSSGTPQSLVSAPFFRPVAAC